VNIPHRNLQASGNDRQSIEHGSDQPVSITSVLRRPTYDILLQLKAEADYEGNQNAQLISALEDNDRQSGVYEGGLKTWEGALDLACLIGQVDFSASGRGSRIVELGAGSAIPSLVALKQVLASGRQVEPESQRTQFRFILSDYNDEVLRFSTWANVLLATKQELDHRQGARSTNAEESLEISEGLVRDCLKLWREVGISFNFISGPWGKEFEGTATRSSRESRADHSTILQHSNLLILASETIYDLQSLPAFTDTVINLLRQHRGESRAWVAAKKLYFGVGGGVDAFVQEVENRGGAVREIMNVTQGVGRVVLEVTVSKER
jgi:protein-histidine N-methyltransferase